jgi:hypothetical protein
MSKQVSNFLVVESRDKACPICHSCSREIIYKQVDYARVSKGKQFFDHRLALCLNCGFLYCPNKYNESDLLSFYTQQPGQYGLTETFCLEKRISQVKSLGVDVCSLLEIGANLKSRFHHWAESNDIRVHLLEPQEDCTETIGKIENIAASSMDVICLYHVLEHVQDLSNFIGHLSRVNTKDGFIIIEVPDILQYGRYANECLIPLHLSHFTIESLTRLFEVIGYKPISVGSETASHPRGICAIFKKEGVCKRSALEANTSARDSNIAIATTSLKLAIAKRTKEDKVIADLVKKYNASQECCNLIIYGANNISSKLIDAVQSANMRQLSNIVVCDDDERKREFFKDIDLVIVKPESIASLLVRESMVLVVTQSNIEKMVARIVELSCNRLASCDVQVLDFR